MKRSFRFPILATLILTSGVGARAQAPKVMDAAEIRLALKRLNVLGSALYIAAHPDDENTALLAYLAKGRLVRTAYLSVTRGEGGQNLIGPEQGEQMGIIRTQELLAARRIDGAEQFFTRAIDFGYSKNSQETLNIWDKEKILSDVVLLIRKFRPDVIMTRFSPTIGGHGNHTSSAILAEEAFRAAGDSSRFPEQLRQLKPWRPTRLLFNTARFFNVALDTSNTIKVDVGEFNPVLGRSFTEIAGMSRSMHKSQGFGASQNRGSNVNYFQHTDGERATKDLFDGVNTSWSRIPRGETAAKLIQEAIWFYKPEEPAALIPRLIGILRQLNELHDDYWVALKKTEVLEIIKACGGIWVEAIASDYSVVPGGRLSVSVSALNRSQYPFILDSISLPYRSADTLLNVQLADNILVQAVLPLLVPASTNYSQPYWLRQLPKIGSYDVTDQNLIGMPQDPPVMTAKFYFNTGAEQLVFDAPVQNRWTDPVEGEQYRPLKVVPLVALNLMEHVYVFPSKEKKMVELVLKSGVPDVAGTVRLKAPAGWVVQPGTLAFALKSKYDEQVVTFQISPGDDAASGNFSAEADVRGTTLGLGISTIRYQHIPTQTLFPSATARLLRIDLKKQGQNIGYVMGAGDEIPLALRQAGYSVTILSDEELAEGNLSKFDAIVSGVRAYNTRPKLKIAQKRLMDYVSEGGTYVVQYVTLQRNEAENLGPYPFSVSHDRVTVEEAPVTFADPNSPVLNVPNKITLDDFNGWIQERGLYFADKWDPKYETPITSNDPGEDPKAGGFLVTHYGKGNYIYTGYAFFRQLPAGIPGAYRLFTNMVSMSKLRKMEKKD